jgi:hypothetical protein
VSEQSKARQREVSDSEKVWMMEWGHDDGLTATTRWKRERLAGAVGKRHDLRGRTCYSGWQLHVHLHPHLMCPGV